MGTAYEETKFILNKYNITANKSLGQNFLINDEIIDSIIEAAKISNEDLVIEIGPGLGTLTSKLLEKSGKVIAVELDKKMITILNERFKLYDNFEIINDDVLKVDLQKIIEKEKSRKDNKSLIKEVKIVANLPYYITTPIMMKLLEDKLDIESITVMVQKEVAERLTAKSGDREAGAITYSVEYYSEAKKIVDVPKESFIPEPEVESEVIQLILRKEPLVYVKDEEKFFKIIKASFMQRRKTILNGLSNSGLVEKEKLKDILKELNLDENIRGEKLTIEQFAKISDRI